MAGQGGAREAGLGRGEGAVPEGVGHVPDEDGGGREGVLQDDWCHASELHPGLARLGLPPRLHGFLCTDDMTVPTLLLG